MAQAIKNFVCTVTPEQIRQLEEYLRERSSWTFSSVPYAHWKAAGEKVNVVAYLSGKLTIQGANTGEFIEFVLEPEILKRVNVVEEATKPEVELDLGFHGGIDESGKGDFFGPLVIAGVVTDENTAPQLAKIGVCDSKLIKSSARIFELSTRIRQIIGGRFSVVVLPPETYNRLYAKIGNLNRLLAWGHARTIENLLDRTPECPRMLSDKFADERLILRALMERGRQIQMEQRTKAESDVAVAAASILAREQFLKGIEALEKAHGVTLPRGASAAVREQARTIFAKGGEAALQSCCKTHFKTYNEVTGGKLPGLESDVM